jgi:hypothetical protein
VDPTRASDPGDVPREECFVSISTDDRRELDPTASQRLNEAGAFDVFWTERVRISTANEPVRPPLAYVVGRLVEAARELGECQIVTHGRRCARSRLSPDARLLSTRRIGSGQLHEAMSSLSPLMAP